MSVKVVRVLNERTFEKDGKKVTKKLPTYKLVDESNPKLSVVVKPVFTESWEYKKLDLMSETQKVQD